MTSLIGVTHVDTIKLYHSCISDVPSLPSRAKCCAEDFDGHDMANLFGLDCSSNIKQPSRMRSWRPPCLESSRCRYPITLFLDF